MDTSTLQWSIAYTLWQTQRLLPDRSRKARQARGGPVSWPPGIDDFATVAGEIANAIKRSGWEVRKKPPSRGHRTPWPALAYYEARDIKGPLYDDEEAEAEAVSAAHLID